jgi:SAM-dependent methyltransferase
MQRCASAQRIVDYYDHCWVERLRAGHNSRSIAIHYGLYLSPDDDAQAAKLETNHQIAELASIGDSPLRVLDAGCGVGGTALDVAARYPSLEIVGVTLSEEQAQLACELAAAAGLCDRVSFAACDYTDTGLPAGSFDVVWAVESLCHAADRRAFLDEVRRLLRAGGRLIVADFFRTDRALDDEDKIDYEARCNGFVISDYYDEPLTSVTAERGWRTAQEVPGTQRALPGLDRSAAKADARLRETSAQLTALQRAHLITCTLMHRFCIAGLLEYRHYRFEPV